VAGRETSCSNEKGRPASAGRPLAGSGRGWGSVPERVRAGHFWPLGPVGISTPTLPAGKRP
jgi:hypothetical protein